MNFWTIGDDTMLLSQNLTHTHSHTPAEVSFPPNVGWVPRDSAPILDKRHQSAYNEPAYHMQGIEHIVPSSMVDLFCNNIILTIAQHVFHKSNISPNSQLPSMSLT
jgi:hypothetical protein